MKYTLSDGVKRESLPPRRSYSFRRRAIPAVLASVLLVVGISQATDSDDLVNRLQQHYVSTGSFTARFVQTLTSPGGPPRHREGKVSYRKPGMIRWEFGPPQPETIVADGTTFYDYDPGLNQVVEMSERSAFKNRSIAAFILGVGDLERDFNIFKIQQANGDETSGVTRLKVTPKDNSTPIELGVDSKSLDIVSLSTTDALGNKTELKLSEIERNVPLQPSSFKFAVPPGADIVNASAGSSNK
jgi:outer membrane lipoprotein carrier protein